MGAGIRSCPRDTFFPCAPGLSSFFSSPDAAEAPPRGTVPQSTPTSVEASRTTATPPVSNAACGSGAKLRVHFYDVGQALSALIDLPDGRHVLVDTADSRHREGCGQVCVQAQSHLLERLRSNLGTAPIDLLWITHQHSDHIGGVPAVLAQFKLTTYVDNGRDLEKTEIKDAHNAAEKDGAKIAVVDPDHRVLSFPANDAVKLAAIVPTAWPSKCSSDPNDCSILLRIDYCASSVMFTGDAEVEEEKLLDTLSPVTLLQVGHHGSNTSSSDALLTKIAPKYAVISAGKPHEGLNKGYCHPRASTVKRLAQHLGGQLTGHLRAYDRDDRCDDADDGSWVDTPVSDRLWATERDGDIVLTTTGDGVFAKE